MMGVDQVCERRAGGRWNDGVGGSDMSSRMIRYTDKTR